MAFGIGSALKRGAKSVGRRIKKNPLKTLGMPNFIDPRERLEKEIDAGVGAVQDVIVPEVDELPVAATAPISDDELSRKKKQRAAQRKYASAGRAGTMLTSDSGSLG